MKQIPPFSSLTKSVLPILDLLSLQLVYCFLYVIQMIMEEIDWNKIIFLEFPSHLSLFSSPPYTNQIAMWIKHPSPSTKGLSSCHLFLFSCLFFILWCLPCLIHSLSLPAHFVWSLFYTKGWCYFLFNTDLHLNYQTSSYLKGCLLILLFQWHINLTNYS